MRKGGYFAEIFRACSQLLNTLVGGRSDITFSTRSQVAYLEGRLWGRLSRAIVNATFKVLKGQKDHCNAALRGEARKLKQHHEYLKGFIMGGPGEKPPIEVDETGTTETQTEDTESKGGPGEKPPIEVD